MILAAIVALTPVVLAKQGPVSPASVMAGLAAQETPIGDLWWPSRWGSSDEAGATNWNTQSKVMDAVQLIESGNVYELAGNTRLACPYLASGPIH